MDLLTYNKYVNKFLTLKVWACGSKPHAPYEKPLPSADKGYYKTIYKVTTLTL